MTINVGSDPLARNPVLIGIGLLAASIWVGGLVCLAVVAGAARRSLEPAAQVAFFRAFAGVTA